jgi:hypothetical protein
MTNTISAAANPALANDLLTKAVQPEEQPFVAPDILAPSDTTVFLPGGYVTAAGEVIRTAEVRELNGKDEEAISKTNNFGKAVLTILQRGTVKIGDETATDQLLDQLLAGDRDALLLGILKVTFGNTPEVASYCEGCSDFKTISINMNEDIKSKILADPIGDRVFIVNGKAGEITVQLPNGVAQKEMILNSDKTSAELNTILLENTVTKINNVPVYNKSQVQLLGITDRRKITDELNKRVPGPQFEDTTVECPDCGSEVQVPINLGALFQF